MADANESFLEAFFKRLEQPSNQALLSAGLNMMQPIQEYSPYGGTRYRYDPGMQIARGLGSGLDTLNQLRELTRKREKEKLEEERKGREEKLEERKVKVLEKPKYDMSEYTGIVQGPDGKLYDSDEKGNFTPISSEEVWKRRLAVTEAGARAMSPTYTYQVDEEGDYLGLGNRAGAPVIRPPFKPPKEKQRAKFSDYGPVIESQKWSGGYERIADDIATLETAINRGASNQDIEQRLFAITTKNNDPSPNADRVMSAFLRRQPVPQAVIQAARSKVQDLADSNPAAQGTLDEFKAAEAVANAPSQKAADEATVAYDKVKRGKLSMMFPWGERTTPPVVGGQAESNLRAGGALEPGGTAITSQQGAFVAQLPDQSRDAAIRIFAQFNARQIDQATRDKLLLQLEGVTP